MSNYQELHWYRFGLHVGLANLRVNRLQLGLKKTLGKIAQPINAYTRFPEYEHCGRQIRQYLSEHSGRQPLKILDVGSPKLFGLYLAFHYNIEIYLTDINRLNIDEYIVLWNALKPHAKGKVIFQEQDARTLSFPDEFFDVVYSMSVIEHIEGTGQDTAAICECLRVLKPAGLLLVSFPFGQDYQEQSIIGVNYSAGETGNEQAFFFQRIYSRDVVEERIIPVVAGQAMLQAWTIRRARVPFVRIYHAVRQKLGQNVNGLLGFLNPFLSMLINADRPGLDSSLFSSYETIHTTRDIYGDLILAARKDKPGKAISHPDREIRDANRP